jgi:prepilin-type N-terminal cleavage/methylation domain-containing protein/prepilin-type processing-associated H-X9-DG protein
MIRKVPLVSHPNAFTLVELLVAVSVVALLAALAAPGIRQGLATSQSAKCVSNLRQLHLAVQGYLTEYGIYPHQDGKINEPPAFYPYVGAGHAACTICPSAQYRGNNSGIQGWARAQSAYGGNPYILTYNVTVRPPPRAANIARPSEIVLLADSSQQGSPPNSVRALEHSFNWWGANEGNPAQAETPISTTTSCPGSSLSQHGFPPELLPLRHRGRGNIIFCDGHVTSITNVTQLKQKNLFWNY